MATYPSPILQDVTVEGALTGPGVDAVVAPLLTSATAASTYETQTSAASTYETQANATATYETIASAASTYTAQVDLASTAAGKGSKLVAFIQRIAGAVGRFVEDKLSEQPSVKDFGATGAGTVDDSAAFVLAQTAYPLGFIVPAGSYRISSSLSLTVPITFMPGAVLIPASGIVVSLSNAIIAGETQIFSVASGGSFALTNQATDCLLSWFGVSPQNTAAQNTAAFNACLSSMPTTGGCHIKWPAGQINVNECTHSLNSIFQEAHSNGTWIVNNTANAYALSAMGTGNFFNVFKGFRVGQASGVTAVGGNGGINIQSQQSRVIDCHCWQYPGALYNGISFDGVVAGWINGNICANMLNDGFRIGGGCGDIFMSENFSVGNGQYGFHFFGSSGVYASNMSAYANAYSAYFFDSSGHANGSGTINEYFFGNNLIGDTSGSSNWQIQNLHQSKFNQCWGSTQQSSTANIYSPGWNIAGSTCNNLTFTGCIAISNNGDGFLIDSAANDIQMIGCSANGNGRGGSYTNGFDVGVGAAVTGITLSACRASGNPGSGIVFGAYASDYCIVTGCNTQGNTGAGFVNNSTGANNAIGTGANV